jgi:hypothetical protein
MPVSISRQVAQSNPAPLDAFIECLEHHHLAAVPDGPAEAAQTRVVGVGLHETVVGS